MKPEKARELAVVLIHLALWSELGVLTRIYLDRFFSGACSGSFGVCLTSEGAHHRSLGAYFTDLPPNMLGSFIMGLLAASGTLGIANNKELAILPASSSWQAAPELHIGLRTGYCGSLTTFASWEYSLVTGLIGGLGKQGGQWAEFLWGLIIGLQLSLSSYVFGQHCALCIDTYLVPGGKAEADPELRAQEEIREIQKVRGGRLSDAERALERDEDVEGRASGDDRLGDDSWQTRQSQPEALQSREPHLENGQAKSSTQMDRSGKGSWVREFFWQSSVKSPFHRKTNLAAVALTGLVTALFIVLTILDREPQHQARRGQWLAILFGPLGCTLRWLLSKTNYKLPGSWNWLPVGTFAANMLACLVDYVIGGASSQVGSIGYWGTIVTYAIRTGFSGALSTVSTFVAEVQGQLKLIPEKLRGYMYSVGSLLSGGLLGVVVYGPMVWTS